jgi:hypothetical protein
MQQRSHESVDHRPSSGAATACTVVSASVCGVVIRRRGQRGRSPLNRTGRGLSVISSFNVDGVTMKIDQRTRDSCFASLARIVRSAGV